MRGPFWETRESCGGTLFRAFEGVVSVHDPVNNNHMLVNAGKSYFSKAGPIKGKKR